MRLWSLPLFALLCTSLPGQSTQPDISTRLLHKDLYLRGLWREDKLKFDEAGKLQGSSGITSIALDGVEVKKVQLKPDRLVIEGRRIGLTFSDYKPKRVVLNLGDFGDSKDEKIQIEIEAPASGDYTAPLTAIFSDLNGMSPILPAWWQPYAKKYLVDSPPTELPKPPGYTKHPKSITRPNVVKTYEPDFNNFARALHYGGRCLVYLQVSKEGKPINVSIVRPIGLGLDERALYAVQQYKFTPAMEAGQPVVVEMNVEVAFQIF